MADFRAKCGCLNIPDVFCLAVAVCVKRQCHWGHEFIVFDLQPELNLQ
jgi:hypothetical protein